MSSTRFPRLPLLFSCILLGIAATAGSADDFKTGPTWAYSRGQGMAKFGFHTYCNKDGYPIGTLQLTDLASTDVKQFGVGKNATVLTVNGTSEFIAIRHYGTVGEDCATGVYRIHFRDGKVWEKSAIPAPDTCLSFLRQTPGLRHLDLNWAELGPLSPEDHESLSSLPDLESFSFAEGKQVDRILQDLAGCKKLVRIGLTNTDATDTGLAHLKRLPKLRFLELGRTEVSDTGLAHLKDAPLEQLDVRSTYVTKDGADAFAKDHPGLKLLWQPGQSREERTAMTRISSLSASARWDGTLRILVIGLSRARVDDELFETIAALPNLKGLIITGPQLRDEHLRKIKALPKIEGLSLFTTWQITDAGLEQMKEMSQLRILEIDSNHITDAGLASLSGLTKLESLSVRSHAKGITDQGLVHLRGLDSLKTLKLRGTGCTKQGVDDLQKHLLKTNIKLSPI